MGALKAGFDYAAGHLRAKRDPFRVERMNATAGKILIEGNAAAAIGLPDGRRHRRRLVSDHAVLVALRDRSSSYMRKYRIDKETGKATFAIVQAEDEIAALGMVIGAGWAGARAMTSTSGPGISLMGEFTGLGYYAEMPGRDLRHPARRARPRACRRARRRATSCRPPCSRTATRGTRCCCRRRSTECYEMAIDAFDLAERLQTPVFVMSRPRPRHEHLDVAIRSRIPTEPLDRGKVLDQATLEASSASGAATRTWTATASRGARCRAPTCPAYFTRGSGHNEKGQYSERADDYQNNLDRLTRKFETARTLVPAPEIDDGADARIGIIAFGSVALGDGRESRDQLRDEAGLKTDVPAAERVSRSRRSSAHFIDAPRARLRGRAEPRRADGRLIRMELDPPRLAKIRSVLHYNGLPIDARSVTDAILAQEGLPPAARAAAPSASRRRTAAAPPALGGGVGSRT